MTSANRDTCWASAFGRTIAIECSDTGITLPFLPTSPWSSTPPTAPIDRAYVVTRLAESSWNVKTDGAQSTTLSTPALVTEHIEGDLHHWIATYTRDYLFVHAGCVAWLGRAIVIPGRSYAGKTTLTRALLDLGATYYSDDYAVIDHDGAVHPFPRLLRVRIDPPMSTTELVDPVRNNWPIGRTAVRAALIAELKFDAVAGWDVIELSRGAGVLSLLDNTVGARERPEDALSLMSCALRDAIAIKGTRDDAQTTARRLIAMVDEVIGAVP